jgi:hypothetical protein
LSKMSSEAMAKAEESSPLCRQEKLASSSATSTTTSTTALPPPPPEAKHMWPSIVRTQDPNFWKTLGVDEKNGPRARLFILYYPELATYATFTNATVEEASDAQLVLKMMYMQMLEQMCMGKQLDAMEDLMNRELTDITNSMKIVASGMGNVEDAVIDVFPFLAHHNPGTCECKAQQKRKKQQPN